MFQNKITGVLEQAAKEQWSYPRVFDAFKNAGVCYYETDVAKYKIWYFSEEEDYLAPTPAGSSEFKVAKEFNKEKIQQAIKRTQAKEIDYPGFLKEIAEAGVVRYRVDMQERTVTYFGQDTNNKYADTVPPV